MLAWLYWRPYNVRLERVKHNWASRRNSGPLGLWIYAGFTHVHSAMHSAMHSELAYIEQSEFISTQSRVREFCARVSEKARSAMRARESLPREGRSSQSGLTAEAATRTLLPGPGLWVEWVIRRCNSNSCVSIQRGGDIPPARTAGSVRRSSPWRARLWV